ncbi:hypothetical protein AKJ48_03970 [candidate division MSBL1 archaeon SCGC-AAA261O19]|uniref:UPF0248 protein AKJ48_03970 n=1 Tax=candidate division MSBL1 archaeon SCGC-AAA261O19 TaxID=1698277 RepID=A0A133VAA0_9EURY|nr:hypothetical protein AKJ48_03970 [candidate division MSBL1 archaeon SCGC-AAA261O19]
MGPRDILNKLKWHPDFSLKGAKITIIHRGAPDDKRVIKGEDITEIGSGFMHVGTGLEKVEIPYHRVLKVETPEKVIWERR